MAPPLIGISVGVAVLTFAAVNIPATFDAKSMAAANSVLAVSPTRFTSVPAEIRQTLLRRGCLVPQDTAGHGLHNIIRGDFVGPRSRVWAALCSRRGMTTLLVIRPGGRTDSLGLRADDPGRSIAAATPAYIWQHAEFYAESAADTAGLRRILTHRGIEDRSGCCSLVYFWDGRRWRELAGAD